MAALSVQVPYPVFYDRDGLPLDNGDIYIGTANTDALTNQIQVYYDEALTITAPQPLKTSGGYIYRNGTPTQVYVNAADFSISVRESNGVVVYNFPTATGTGVGAASIEYDPPFTGALTSGYTVSDKLKQTISVKDFGAVGNGVANDTVAIQAAVNATPSGGTLIITPGVYMVEKITLSNPINLVGDRATLKLIPVTSVFPALAPPIIEIFSNNITFDGIFFDGNRWLQTGGHSDWVVFHRRSCAITGYDVKYTNLTIQNCTFDNFYNGAVIIMADNTRIVNCNFTNINTEAYICAANQSAYLPEYPAVADIITDGVFIDTCYFKNIGTKDTPLDARQYGNDLPVVTGDVLLLRAKNTTITNSQFFEFDREAIKFERPDGNHIISNNVFINSFDGNSDYTVLQFNSASAAKTPSATSPSNIVITNNVMSRPSGLGGIGGGSVKVHYGVVISNNVVTANSGATNGLLILSGVESCVVSNNIFTANNASNPGIKLTTAYGNLRNLTFTNNRIKTVSSISVQLSGNATGTYEDFDFFGNVMTGIINAASTDAAPLIFNNFNIINNRVSSINFTSSGAARPNLTNIVVANNITTSPVAGNIASGFVEGNIVQTISGASRNVVDGYLSNLTAGSHFKSGSSGQVCVFPDAATTPSVKGKTFFSAENTAATTITNFSDPSSGQEITIYFSNGNTTLAESGNIRLAGAGNFVGTADDIITLIYVDFVGWIEKGRSVN